MVAVITRELRGLPTLFLLDPMVSICVAGSVSSLPEIPCR